MTTQNIIHSTGSNDMLTGTSAVDVFIGSAGNDLFDGADAGYNQVNYDGSPADFTFITNSDGSVSVKKPGGGIDTLKNISGFWFNGAGVWLSLDQALASHGGGSTPTPPSSGTINGTSGNDYLTGTAGNDVINGLGGQDTIKGSAGSDRIDGGDAGYNQVDYAGAPADYEMVRNSDGSICVKKPGGGVDTLTNISGFWFEGAGVWLSLQDALVTCGCDDDTGNGNGNGGGNGTINGTTGNDYIHGTAGNDVINGLGGQDTIKGSTGSDMIDGGDAGYNQVDYAGSVKDYVITKNADGSYTVKKPDGGVDTLKNIDGFWFEGEAKWYGIDDAVAACGGGNGGGMTPPANTTTANDDSVDTGVGTPVTINVLANDTDAQGDAQSIQSFSNGANGSVAIVNGQLVYTPKAGFVGIDTFTYTVVDSKGATDTATVEVCIEDEPQPVNTASIGDKVWLDANKNGVQDDGEAGVSGVTVQLKDGNGNVIATQQTDANGNYLFDKLAGGNYQVGVTAPSQYELTAKDAFGNGADAIDSDVNVATGHTDTITLGEGQAIRTVDAGLVEKVYNDGCIEGTLFAGQYRGEIRPYPGAAEVIKNATINLLDGSGNVVATTKADATGYYKFDGLGSGSYNVQIVSTSLELAMWNTSLAGIDVHWMTDLRSNVALNEAGIFGDKAENLDSDVASVVTTNNSIMMRGKQVIVTTQEVHISGEACCVTIDAGFKTNINNGSPIMFDLNGDGEIGVTGETTSQDKADITSIGETVSFDLDGDGVNEQIEWSDGKGDGFLVDMTKIGANGEINGSALFGDEGGTFANGYDKLALHDLDGDGMIMGAELEGLGVWIDNGDAILQDGELKSAAELNITSVSADMQIVYDDAGRALMQATAEVDGETVLTEDVWFAQEIVQPDYVHQAA